MRLLGVSNIGGLRPEMVGVDCLHDKISIYCYITGPTGGLGTMETCETIEGKVQQTR
jgi:hypothetical protein